MEKNINKINSIGSKILKLIVNRFYLLNLGEVNRLIYPSIPFGSSWRGVAEDEDSTRSKKIVNAAFSNVRSSYVVLADEKEVYRYPWQQQIANTIIQNVSLIRKSEFREADSLPALTELISFATMPYLAEVLMNPHTESIKMLVRSIKKVMTSIKPMIHRDTSSYIYNSNSDHSTEQVKIGNNSSEILTKVEEVIKAATAALSSIHSTRIRRRSIPSYVTWVSTIPYVFEYEAYRFVQYGTTVVIPYRITREDGTEITPQYRNGVFNTLEEWLSYIGKTVTIEGNRIDTFQSLFPINVSIQVDSKMKELDTNGPSYWRRHSLLVGRYIGDNRGTAESYSASAYGITNLDNAITSGLIYKGITERSYESVFSVDLMCGSDWLMNLINMIFNIASTINVISEGIISYSSMLPLLTNLYTRRTSRETTTININRPRLQIDEFCLLLDELKLMIAIVVAPYTSDAPLSQSTIGGLVNMQPLLLNTLTTGAFEL